MLIDDWIAAVERLLPTVPSDLTVAGGYWLQVAQGAVAYRFDAGAIPDVDVDARPPHPHCWIEYPLPAGGVEAWLTDGRFEICATRGDGLTHSINLLGTSRVFRALCAALESGACEVEVRSPDEALQRSRAKAGKAPLRAYSYVQLRRSPAPRGAPGDRPDVRRHPVRGHWRAVGGRAVYIRPHWRGSIEAGIVPLRRRCNKPVAILSADGYLSV